MTWGPRLAYPGLALHVDGLHVGTVTQCSGVWAAATLDNDAVNGLPDEPTARAVLLALVGEDPGATVALSLRDSWTREDVDRARDAGLGWYIAALLEDYAADLDDTQHTERAEAIRQWVAGGQGLMTLRVVEESADDCPF